jgi:tRNA (guanine26-N2/guanine27-N2)-dimethyltransferase
VHPKACIRKYGGKPLRTEYCHEIALRLLIASTAATAAKHEIGVYPLFSHSTDHYVRFYAVLRHGAQKADETLKQLGYILHCFNCLQRETVHKNVLLGHDGKCQNCGSKMDYAGPVWLGKLADEKFCDLMEEEFRRKRLESKKRVEKILALVKAECSAPITYYVLDEICSKMHLPVPSTKAVLEALKRRGFEALPTHFNPKGIKSNATVMGLTATVKQLL